MSGHGAGNVQQQPSGAGTPGDRHSHEMDPDYRFTLANERTFLAWIRTTLGLLAGSVAIVHLVPDVGMSGFRRGVGSVLAVLGIAVAASAIHRWTTVQNAMRRGEDLPPTRMPIYLGAALVVVGVGVVVVLIVGDTS